jgi:hypothetical protein
MPRNRSIPELRAQRGIGVAAFSRAPGRQGRAIALLVTADIPDQQLAAAAQVAQLCGDVVLQCCVVTVGSCSGSLVCEVGEEVVDVLDLWCGVRGCCEFAIMNLKSMFVDRTSRH